MKRFFICTVVLLIIFSFTGCGSETNANEEPNNYTLEFLAEDTRDEAPFEGLELSIADIDEYAFSVSVTNNSETDIWVAGRGSDLGCLEKQVGGQWKEVDIKSSWTGIDDGFVFRPGSKEVRLEAKYWYGSKKSMKFPKGRYRFVFTAFPTIQDLEKNNLEKAIVIWEEFEI